MKLSRTVLVVGGNFYRHMESGAFQQGAGILRDYYSFKNQRKTHFSELVFITVSLFLINTTILQYAGKVEGGALTFCLPSSLSAVDVRVIIVVTYIR